MKHRIKKALRKRELIILELSNGKELKFYITVYNPNYTLVRGQFGFIKWFMNAKNAENYLLNFTEAK